MWILLEKQPLAVIFLYHNPVRRISFEKQILSRNLNQPNHYQLPLRRMKLAVWHRRWGARLAVTILSKPWDLYINYKTSWHYSALPIDSKEGFSFFLNKFKMQSKHKWENVDLEAKRRGRRNQGGTVLGVTELCRLHDLGEANLSSASHRL